MLVKLGHFFGDAEDSPFGPWPTIFAGCSAGIAVAALSEHAGLDAALELAEFVPDAFVELPLDELLHAAVISKAAAAGTRTIARSGRLLVVVTELLRCHLADGERGCGLVGRLLRRFASYYA